MPGGRGRGLGPKRLAEVFTPEPEYENIWDNPIYAWSKPKAGEESLREYLAGSDYWGYKDWTPEAAWGEKHPQIDPGNLPGYYLENPTIPEYHISRRLKKLTNPADKMALSKAMQAEWAKFKPGVPTPSFSLLQKLRYMAGQGTNVPWSYTGREGYNRFAGRPGTGGSQEGGGKGNENILWSPSVRPGTPPVSPVSPQYAAPQAAAPMRPRGPSRTLGPRQRPVMKRPLRDIFNGSGGSMPRRW